MEHTTEEVTPLILVTTKVDNYQKNNTTTKQNSQKQNGGSRYGKNASYRSRYKNHFVKKSKASLLKFRATIGYKNMNKKDLLKKIVEKIVQHVIKKAHNKPLEDVTDKNW